MMRKSGLSEDRAGEVRRLHDLGYASISIARSVGVDLARVDNEINAYHSESKKSYLSMLASMIF